MPLSDESIESSAASKAALRKLKGRERAHFPSDIVFSA